MAHHIFIQGPLGAGKTFLMSVLAKHWQEKSNLMGANVKLFSNYDLEGSMKLEHYTDWYDVARAHGSIVAIDEAQMVLSNRRWSTYGNQAMADLLFYTRKMQAVLLYASPSINNVDTKLRDIIEILIDVRKIGKKGFKVSFTDWQAKQFMHSNFIPMSLANRFFKLDIYDTYNIVQYLPLPNNEREGKEFFLTLEKIHNKARGKRRLRA